MPTFKPYTIHETYTQLNGGEYILSFSENRVSVTNRPVETLSKYRKAGFRLLAASQFWIEWPQFICLNMNFSEKLKNGVNVIDGTAAFHLKKAIQNNKLSFD